MGKKTDMDGAGSVRARHRCAGRIIGWRRVDARPIHAKDIVRKTFQLNQPGKNRDRVLDATRHEIRQYLKRERRKTLPEGVDYWDFDCRFGSTQENASAVHLAQINALIDALAADGGDAFYLELIAKPGLRATKAAPQD